MLNLKTSKKINKVLNTETKEQFENKLELLSNSLILNIYWKQNIKKMLLIDKTKKDQEINKYIEILEKYIENLKTSLENNFTFIKK